jgi:hypothetical protein
LWSILLDRLPIFSYIQLIPKQVLITLLLLSLKTLVYTDVKVLVDEYLKGDGPKEIIITLPGGTLGDETQWVSDVPQFDVGDYGVILLESSGQVTGGPDGIYLLRREDIDGFLRWLRAYIAGDPKASREGPPEGVRVRPK